MALKKVGGKLLSYSKVLWVFFTLSSHMPVYMPEIIGAGKSNFSKLKNARLNKPMAVNRYHILLLLQRLRGVGH